MCTNEQKGVTVGPLHKRQETMADGRRYIIYYTFGDEKPEPIQPAPTPTVKEENAPDV
jgi:hypothetical protein